MLSKSEIGGEISMDDTAVPLQDGNYSVEVQPGIKDEMAIYIFKQHGSEYCQYDGVIPKRLTPTSTVSKEIKKVLDPDNKYTPKALNEDLDAIRVILQERYETILLVEEQKVKDELAEQERALNLKLTEAEEKLKSLQNPIIWIGSVIDWLTAGERNNILLAFIAYSSQVILHNPISVIALGESGSGKTHVEEIGLSFIPREFKVYEKKITEAALFNRAKSDPWFYDGKIVIYGDMGGKNDMDFAEESKDLMKELQSDGHLNKPLSVPDGEGGWIVQDLELWGKPCLNYTTVPGYAFDEQEMSRSIFITPRLDNRAIFNARATMLEFKGGKTYNQMKYYEKESEIIKYMIYHLREVLFDIDIINPYVSIIIKFLEDSDYYKRDFPKYNGLLKTITALNFYKHTVYEVEGRKIIYSTLEDVKLFMSLLKPYHESINANISPKATEILEDLREHMDEYITSTKRETLTDGISSNEYFEFQNLGLGKRSIQRYFGELNSAGFIKIVDKVGHSNAWNLTGKVSEDKINELIELTDDDKNIISYELGEDVMKLISDDSVDLNLNISNQDVEVDVPKWMKFDKKNDNVT